MQCKWSQTLSIEKSVSTCAWCLLPHPNATSSLCEQLLTLEEGQLWQVLRQLYELLQET